MSTRAAEPHASTESEPAPETGHRGYLLTLLGLAILGLWLVSLKTSLWLDETATYWVVKDSLKTAIVRAARYEGQTPLYYVIEWLDKSILGKSEIALRMPSLIAMSFATWLIYRLGKRLFDKEAALLAVLVFVANPLVSFFSIDARPYALAVLCLTASTLLLVRWLDEHKTKDAFGYVILAALTIYMHYLFAPAFLAHAFYVWKRRHEISLRGAAIGAGTIGILLAPSVPQLISLLHRSAALSIPAGRQGGTLFDTLAPSVLLASIIVGLLVASLIRPISFAGSKSRARGLLLAGSWLILSPAVLFLISQFGGRNVFVDRYLISASGGLALLAGWAVASIEPPFARRLALTTLVMFTALLLVGRYHFPEDWRGAIATANPLIPSSDTPVLIHTAFVESAQIDWLTQPERADYLMAPLSYYPLRGHAIAMPYLFTSAARTYIEGLVKATLLKHDRFFLITRYDFVPFGPWLEARLEPYGYQSRTVGNFAQVIVYEFSRTGFA